MEIVKTTEKYKFYQEGVNYILELGDIKNGENTTTELLVTGIEDSNLLQVVAHCGCTTTDKQLIDKNTQSIKISYTQCDPSFAKILEIKYKGVKLGTIKLKGKCQQ